MEVEVVDVLAVLGVDVDVLDGDDVVVMVDMLDEGAREIERRK